MKKIWRLAILLSLASFIIQGCNDNDEPSKIISREKPVSWTRVLGPNEDKGEIPIVREPQVWQDFVVASGRGTFISAVISKSRNDDVITDSTLVKLCLDYKEVSVNSFKQVRAMGLSEQNYSGVVRLEGPNAVETLVLGYSQPLYFDEVLILSVMVDDPIEDPKIEKFLLTVTFTKVDTGDDEGTGGGNGVPDFP